MSRIELLPQLVVKAKRSEFWLFVLNILLARTIPFNRPHKYRIAEIGEDLIRTYCPYRRSNHNHIRGIHACAIATVAEFSAGFLLISQLDPAQYRLIMSKLDADYSYQAKEDILAESRLTRDRLQNEVILPLEKIDAVPITMTTLVSDLSGNKIASVKTSWQVKRWDKVRTEV